VIAVVEPWFMNNSSVIKIVFGDGDVFSVERLLTDHEELKMTVKKVKEKR
jgi:hypothetical protein